MNTISDETKDNVARFYTMLKNLDAFNEKEVRGIVFGQLSPTLREQCFLGNYLRAIANVKSMLKLDNIADSQAVAMIARSVFELAVEIELIDRVADGPKKILAFGEYERLRRARTIVRFAETHSDHSPHLDVPLHKSFADREGARIDSERDRLWPDWKKLGLTHWSQLKLRARAELVGNKILEMYDSEYQVHSWYTHAGITGVTNTQPEFYWALCAVAHRLTSDSFEIILQSIIKTFRLALTDVKILDKLEFAKIISFTESDVQAIELRKSMIG